MTDETDVELVLRLTEQLRIANLGVAIEVIQIDVELLARLMTLAGDPVTSEDLMAQMQTFAAVTGSGPPAIARLGASIVAGLIGRADAALNYPSHLIAALAAG